ncbi:MAG: hypothetical protein NWE93_04045 [Candidatus Bathyarchaeota archaeon]|nr:hypothetical protein [Candidatus Bathyarchaeota archaeon]
MMSPDWKYAETVQKRIRITRVDPKSHHVDASDLDFGGHLCLDADAALDLGKVKRAKIYVATIKVYHAEFTDDLERQMTESALGDIEHLRAIQAMKATGSALTKLQLTALKH